MSSSRVWSAVLLTVLASAACRPVEARSPSTDAQVRQKPQDDLPPMLPDIEKQDIGLATGPEAKIRERVSVHYTGYLLAGTKFDSSLDPGPPFALVIGHGQ